MLALWGIATALTLLLTRSSLAKEYIHAKLQGKPNDLVTCPLCCGFWITLGTGLILHSPAGNIAAAYVLMVLAITLYDALHFYAWEQ